MGRFKQHGIFALGLVALLAVAGVATADDPVFTDEFNRDGCTFATAGNTQYFPLWPGLSVTLEGEEEDDGEIVDIKSVNTVLPDTERVDGVLTRVYEEREYEDDELVEVSRNFVAICRETGDVWYFGEDVDDYEDGLIVGHDGAWRAGVNGAEPGILIPGNPLVGARFYQEVAPGVAMDQGEIAARGVTVETDYGTFDNCLQVNDTDALDPGEPDVKYYAPGIGNIVDEELEITELTMPACVPDATTHCLNDGRFEVKVDWEDAEGNEGDGMAILPSGDSGEFWFFSVDNTEILVKVLDGCALNNNYWVFVAGLTNVEVTVEVTDTANGTFREYENSLGDDFEPVLDTEAFDTCP